jgi:hypothetical protein
VTTLKRFDLRRLWAVWAVVCAVAFLGLWLKQYSFNTNQIYWTEHPLRESPYTPEQVASIVANYSQRNVDTAKILAIAALVATALPAVVAWTWRWVRVPR